MQSVNVKRSQAILRMPVDMVDATLILHDGDRAEVLLFVPPTEDISRLLAEGPAFVPIVRGGTEHFVARSAIAALAVPAERAPRLDEDMPIQTQGAVIKLRSGTELEGELRWNAPASSQRTSDHLNSDAPIIVIYVGDATYIVLKHQIAWVVEK
jgi:hypothetical protein